MNLHALAVLEFGRVLELVAGRATSELGAARLRSLTPTADIQWIEAEHGRVAAVRSLTEAEHAWSPEPAPNLEAALARLRAAGSRWSGHELLMGAQLLRSARCTRDMLGDAETPAAARAVLGAFGARLLPRQPVEGSIDRALDTDGTVRDDASPMLRRIRRELRGAHGELVQLLERAMANLPAHLRVADASVTVRNGRFVIPVRREGRGQLGGIVHDESATGGTLFVEPPAAVEFGNRVRELESDEEREVERILTELTDTLRPLHSALVDALDVLVELDTLYARARFATEFRCTPCGFTPAHEGFDVHGGRHPLLVARGGNVVPFDLSLASGERTLLLSGPNTGGKTVLLKAIGLLSAMGQAGIPPTVGAESRVAVCDDCFADIGDEQSIQASLSTFSAHVAHLAEILRRATRDSLVLIDELGSGTDPAEGAALGAAILEELTEREALTVATTHLGALKLLATEQPAVVNASLQFDAQALAPTFRLIKGIPGRSYGLGIARRLRLPEDVLARADSRMASGERDVAALLVDLERREVELGDREARAADALERAHARVGRIDERERRLRDEERTLERRARQEARQMLLDARGEVEGVIRGLRDTANELDAREARRRIEALAAEQTSAIEELERLDEQDVLEHPADDATAVTTGDLVELDTLGGRAGRVMEMRGDDVVVAVGALKVTVPRASLRRSAKRAMTPTDPLPVPSELPDVEAATEVDLRGMRVEEMERALMFALDAAVRADLKSLRIIHGKGTGTLRERVGELLRGDDRVKHHRLGVWNEGGVGVTIAELA